MTWSDFQTSDSDFQCELTLRCSFERFCDLSICDKIKGNKSDIGHVDFELHAYRGDKFVCFTLFLT